MTDETKETTGEETKSEETKKVEAKTGSDDKRYIDDIVKWKTQYKSAKEELEAIKTKSDSEKQELSTKVEATIKEKALFEKRYIDAELKAQAVAAGIKDTEFVKLIEKGDIKIDEQGNIEGIDKAIEDLKTRKPDWFGTEKKSSSSSNASFPDKGKTQPLDARTMSKEDWNKNKARIMAGKFV